MNHTKTISVTVGGPGEPATMAEAVSMVIEQLGGPLGKRCSCCKNLYGLTQDRSGIPRVQGWRERWDSLRVLSRENGQETRECHCGSHISIALMDFEAPDPLPFGERRVLP